MLGLLSLKGSFISLSLLLLLNNSKQQEETDLAASSLTPLKVV